MAYDPGLAERIEEFLEDRPGFVKIRMFGGLGWLLHGNMCVGVWREWLITRVGQAQADTLQQEADVEAMDITGKPMKGWIKVAPDGVAEDQELSRHINLAIQFVTTLPMK